MEKVRLEEVSKKRSSNLAQKDVEGLNGDYPIYGAAGYIGNVDFYHQEDDYVAVVKDGAGIGRTMFLPAKSSVIGTLQYIIPEKNVLPKYLYYAVKNMKLAKYYTGATIPHIYYKDYKKETFWLRGITEQKQIVTILEKVEKVINEFKELKNRLDDLVQYRFVEMFGDPVANSKGWEQFPLYEVTEKIGSGATPRGGKESYQSEGITLIRSMNVYDRYFEYKELAHITDQQAKQLDNVAVKENDVFINITGASIARSCIVPKGILPARVNQHVSIIRCITRRLNPVFANNMFVNNSFKRKLLAIGEANGATRQAITKQQLETILVIMPPLKLQNQFATFVHQIDKSKVA